MRARLVVSGQLWSLMNRYCQQRILADHTARLMSSVLSAGAWAVTSGLTQNVVRSTHDVHVLELSMIIRRQQRRERSGDFYRSIFNVWLNAREDRRRSKCCWNLSLGSERELS
jgi:hypothetical protein